MVDAAARNILMHLTGCERHPKAPNQLVGSGSHNLEPRCGLELPNKTFKIREPDNNFKYASRKTKNSEVIKPDQAGRRDIHSHIISGIPLLILYYLQSRNIRYENS